MLNILLNTYILTLLDAIEAHVWCDHHPHLEDLEVRKDTLNCRLEKKKCRQHTINTTFWNYKISLKEKKKLVPLKPKWKECIPIQTHSFC